MDRRSHGQPLNELAEQSAEAARSDIPSRHSYCVPTAEVSLTQPPASAPTTTASADLQQATVEVTGAIDASVKVRVRALAALVATAQVPVLCDIKAFCQRRARGYARQVTSLYAVSDLHVRNPRNRELVSALRPRSREDWVIVAGDVAEHMSDIHFALGHLADTFSKVFWVPGNHELWTLPRGDSLLRGEDRYRELIQWCRSHGIMTPEDPFALWEGPGGPAIISPLFVPYDYSFRHEGLTVEQALESADEAGTVCMDEFLLHTDPYPTMIDWCNERVRLTTSRLDEIDTALPTILVNHWPLVREPTRLLHYPDFAMWCGTTQTADWHVRYRCKVAVYGHLHIPRTTVYDGVRFEEVSWGYPNEWSRRAHSPKLRVLFSEDA